MIAGSQKAVGCSQILDTVDKIKVKKYQAALHVPWAKPQEEPYHLVVPGGKQQFETATNAITKKLLNARREIEITSGRLPRGIRLPHHL